MINFKHPGNVLTLTAPVGGVVSSGGYLIGAIFAVAAYDAAAGEEFEGQVCGVFKFTKSAGQVWAEGDLVYWNDTAKEAGNVGPLDAYIGVATKAALGGDATGYVRLNAVGQAAPVTLAGAAVFVSNEETGTGAPQNIAHGLGVVPSAVFVTPTDLAPATTGEYTVVEGAHDAANVVLTVTTSKKFKVMAWA